jgi:hypothetical protein
MDQLIRSVGKSSSGYMGVYPRNATQFIARCQLPGCRSIAYLGYFDTAEEAAHCFAKHRRTRHPELLVGPPSVTACPKRQKAGETLGPSNGMLRAGVAGTAGGSRRKRKQEHEQHHTLHIPTTVVQAANVTGGHGFEISPATGLLMFNDNATGYRGVNARKSS